MSCYDTGLRGFGNCFSSLNSPQGVIIFSAIVGLLLVEVLDKDTLEKAGNIVLTIGQLMVTAEEFCGK